MGKWEYAEELLDAVTFAIEFVIFTLFIYEEAMQIHNRMILDRIAYNSKTYLFTFIPLNFDYTLSNFVSFFNNYGILALYGCNSYSHYIYVSYMTREWAKIWLGDGRQEYSVYTTGIFGTS
jgi:hypothetical protein